MPQDRRKSGFDAPVSLKGETGKPRKGDCYCGCGWNVYDAMKAMRKYSLWYNKQISGKGGNWKRPPAAAPYQKIKWKNARELKKDRVSDFSQTIFNRF